MHTKQLFPAVCFCKDLIPDALIFLLWLNTLFKQDFFAFLGFQKWSHTHTFLSHCLTLPCLRPCLRPVPNLWLLLLLFQIAGFITAARGATMMIVEIDAPTFPSITFIIRGKSRKMKVSQSPLEEWRKRPDLSERDSSKFFALLFDSKIREMLDCIVYSSFDVRIIRYECHPCWVCASADHSPFSKL